MDDAVSGVPATSSPEFMTVEEAAELLRVNRHTLYGAIKSESPPWARTIGRVVRINRAALLKWFEQGSEQKKGRRRL